jgi:hypothetical protein
MSSASKEAYTLSFTKSWRSLVHPTFRILCFGEWTGTEFEYGAPMAIAVCATSFNSSPWVACLLSHHMYQHIIPTNSGNFDCPRIGVMVCLLHRRQSRTAWPVRSTFDALAINSSRPNLLHTALARGHWKSMCFVSSTLISQRGHCALTGICLFCQNCLAWDCFSISR